jgi:uncharacterized protein
MSEAGHPATAPVDLVRDLAERFAAGDRAEALELFHPDLRIQQPESLPHGGWHHGLDGMDAMGRRFAQYWDRDIKDARILGCGEVVVQVTTQTWTAKSTARSATADVVELFSFADGRIVEIRVFQQDTKLLLDTLDPA